MGPSSAKWAPYLLAALVGAACVTAPGEFRAPGTERGIPFRLFPELGPVGASYRWIGGAVPPDRNAPDCPHPTPPPGSWPVERVGLRSHFVETLEIALPQPLAGGKQPDAGVPTDAETHGSILVASWSEPMSQSERGHPTAMHVAAWVGPEDGYPTVGADTAARQVRARQCRLRTAGGEGHVVEFTLRGPQGIAEYVGAVWSVTSGRYLRVLVTGFDATRLAEVHAILGSIQAVPRRR
jgi:hypothetical protein